MTEPQEGPSRALIGLIAFATGALVANIYYSQPLIGMIAPQLHIGVKAAGALVGVTQIGYGVGLFFLVSASDLVETKRLVLSTLAAVICALIVLATAQNGLVFMAASFVVGVCSTGVQVLVPFAAHLANERTRGRVVGSVMGGLLTGIMLARPISLFIAGALGWRAVFWSSAGLMVVIGLLLGAMMPRWRPTAALSYPRILSSMLSLMTRHAPLRRRTAYQALMFAAFNLFWTAAPLMLAERFGLNVHGIALFALAGAGGALAAPITGRLADRGLVRASTLAACLALGIGFAATHWAVLAGALAVLVALAVLIDAAVQTNQVAGQRVIFDLDPSARGRINAIYMSLVFLGGALGSTISTAAYSAGGWPAIAAIGAVIGFANLALALTEPRSPAVAADTKPAQRRPG